MSKNRTSLIAALLIAVVAALSLTSCDDDDPYYGDPLVGQWTLTAPLFDEWDATQFVFYPDGTGTLSQYDQYYEWVTYPISWDADPSTLWVYTSAETWTYQWQVVGMNLYLYDLDTGASLTYIAN